VLIDLKVDCGLLDNDIPVLQQAFIDVYNTISHVEFFNPLHQIVDSTAVIQHGP
jgi:hypothetical protein